MLIGEFCKTGAGGTPLKSKEEFYIDGDIPWLLSGEVGKKKYIYEAKNNITKLGLKNSSAKVFPKNSVLIAMYGATAGEVGMLKIEAATNQAVCAIFPSDKVIPEYLYYFFTIYKDKLVAQAVGNAQPNISQAKIKNTDIPLPPLEEQQKIVAILDQAFAEIDKARTNAEQNLNNARELFDSYLNQVFSQRGEGREEKKLGDVVVLEYGKPLAKEMRSESGLYPAYGANGVKARTDEFYFDQKTIIVGRKGSAGELTISEDKFWPLDVTYYVVYDQNLHDLIFLYYLMRKQNLPSLATGVKPGINRNKVYALKVLIPSLEQQRELSHKLQAMAADIESVEKNYLKKMEYLDELKQSILQKAFSGELTG